MKPHKYQSIVILTGAGISAESGVKTFRDQNGLWENHRIEDVATPEAFARDPALVHNFYNMRRQQLLSDDVKPNAAHKAIAALQNSHPDVFLVTQNIDNLHELGGSTQVHHMHGELLKSSCTACPAISDINEDLSTDMPCPGCGEIGTRRPHIVWFGEMPIDMDLIFEKLMNCDLFISIGTSGNVYPAAGFVQEARMSGAHTVELNLEPSQGASMFAEHHHGKATEIVPEYLKMIT
ncbi:MAG: NAD-dependent protein deacylase [Micavibrio sp.]|nr:NAD-dependent protein deacylase [Micavibrio sp.]HCK33161.1 NAD-dependent protein deacylase [Rhodospirillaceae bacterium]